MVEGRPILSAEYRHPLLATTDPPCSVFSAIAELLVSIVLALLYRYTGLIERALIRCRHIRLLTRRSRRLGDRLAASGWFQFRSSVMLMDDDDVMS